MSRFDIEIDVVDNGIGRVVASDALMVTSPLKRLIFTGSPGSRIGLGASRILSIRFIDARPF